jgi:hypothetical protein
MGRTGAEAATVPAVPAITAATPGHSTTIFIAKRLSLAKAGPISGAFALSSVASIVSEQNMILS